MKAPSVRPVRSAIYTRVSTEHGLDQEFNSLDAQYDAASAYIKSQAHAGWTLIRSRYDDGGYSGGSTDRPDLQRLLEDIRGRKIDVIVVYKVDRLNVVRPRLRSPLGGNDMVGTVRAMEGVSVTKFEVDPHVGPCFPLSIPQLLRGSSCECREHHPRIPRIFVCCRKLDFAGLSAPRAPKIFHSTIAGHP